LFEQTLGLGAWALGLEVREPKHLSDPEWKLLLEIRRAQMLHVWKVAVSDGRKTDLLLE